jgi:translation initiation factor IF-1
MATKEEKIEMEGEVVEAFPNGMFKIQLDAGHEVLGYTAGKMRRFRRLALDEPEQLRQLGGVDLAPVERQRGCERLQAPVGRIARLHGSRFVSDLLSPLVPGSGRRRAHHGKVSCVVVRVVTVRMPSVRVPGRRRHGRSSGDRALDEGIRRRSPADRVDELPLRSAHAAPPPAEASEEAKLASAGRAPA